MTSRKIVTSGNGFALAEWRDGDREWFIGRDDGAFDVDHDDRKPLHHVVVHRLVVLDLSDGQLVGQVNWHAVGYGRTYPCGAWNVGIGLLPESRGRGAGTVALRLLAEHLFATTDFDRVEASSDIANRRAHLALRKAGFRTEGIIRGAQLRGGERRDMVGFAMLRSELTQPGQRTVVIARDGVALATPAAGDGARFMVTSHEFDVDRDDRPPMTIPIRQGRLGVVDEASGTVLGGVSWHAVDYGGTVGCCAWNIGIGLLAEARGRGVGALAQRLLAEHLFATTELDRVEATTDVDNIAEQRALENAGFHREGVLRGAQLRGGERRDMAHYAVLRTDLAPPPRERTVVVARDGIALTTTLPGDRERFRAAHADSAYAVDTDDRPPLVQPASATRLAIVDERTGTVLGGISWHAVDYGGSYGCTAWNVGIGLLAEARGRGVGTLAQRLLAEHLFATTDLDRVEATTDVENVAEQRALEKAGFQREGVLRGAQLRGGERRDVAHYAILRTDL